MKLGFIGLGAMGAPIATNLLEAGHEISVWNRSPKRVDPLVEAGARRADSPADAATQILIVGGGFGGLAAVRELARTFGGSQDVGVALLYLLN
jgi:3-hydroxyisobutyrate dehydrogenase-like beta-hydroxyacid dehydrogenase